MVPQVPQMKPAAVNIVGAKSQDMMKTKMVNIVQSWRRFGCSTSTSGRPHLVRRIARATVTTTPGPAKRFASGCSGLRNNSFSLQVSKHQPTLAGVFLQKRKSVFVILNEVKDPGILETWPERPTIFP